jgi:hypothetical protein
MPLPYPTFTGCPSLVGLATTPVPLLKPRARHDLAWAGGRRSGGLPSAARRRALRSGCDTLGANLRPPLHFSRSPTTDRSPSLNQLRIEVQIDLSLSQILGSFCDS